MELLKTANQFGTISSTGILIFLLLWWFTKGFPAIRADLKWQHRGMLDENDKTREHCTSHAKDVDKLISQFSTQYTTINTTLGILVNSNAQLISINAELKILAEEMGKVRIGIHAANNGIMSQVVLDHEVQDSLKIIGKDLTQLRLDLKGN